MRSYSVAAVALALDVQVKWLDNLLSQNRVAGVTQSRQGVARRVSPGALYVIATVRDLNTELQVPVATALRLAHRIWTEASATGQSESGALRVGNFIIELDRDALRRRVEAGLATALEMTPRPRRGRPPRAPRPSGA